MRLERRRGKVYLYRRQAGRTEYVASGLLAEALALADAIDRQRRDEARARLRTEQADAADLDAVLDRLDRAADLAAVVALTDAGFHQHRRQWRRRAVS
jgi:hypothetical protein